MQVIWIRSSELVHKFFKREDIIQQASSKIHINVIIIYILLRLSQICPKYFQGFF